MSASDETQSLKNRTVSKEISKDNPGFDAEEEGVLELEILRTIRKTINDANWKIVKGQHRKDVSEVETWRTFQKAISDINFVKGRPTPSTSTSNPFSESNSILSALHLPTPINAAEEVEVEVEAGELKLVGDYIPMDIVAKILVGVSAMPLQRFKCVSKHWCNLITSKTFIQHHLQNQQMLYNKFCDHPRGTNVNGIHIFFCLEFARLYHNDNHSYKLYTLDLGSANSISIGKKEKISVVDGLQRISKPDKSRTIPIGSCNGIVCLQNTRGTGFALFNPSNRTYLKLPGLKKVQLQTLTRHRVFHGFGYDVASDDYKVVMIVQCYQKSDIPLCDTTVMICSRRQKEWREFQDSIYEIDLHSTSTYCNNMLHWIAKVKDPPKQDRRVIIRFDLCKEKFDEVTFPVLEVCDRLGLKLANLHGMLLLMIKSDWRQPHTDLWMMKVYGVNESWCKLVSVKNCVKNSEDSLWPITLSKSGKHLLAITRLSFHDGCKIAWIDIATGEKRTSYNLPTLAQRDGYDRFVQGYYQQPFLPSLINLNVDESAN